MRRIGLAIGLLSALAGASWATSEPPPIKKLGTIDCDMVETTPVAFQGRLYRLEYVRDFYYKSNTSGHSYFRFVDVATGASTPEFAQGRHLGSAFVDGDTVYAFGVDKWGGTRIDMFWSKDMIQWEEKPALELAGWEIFNTSVCKGPDGYVMAFEIGAPKDQAGEPFTSRFARSKDLANWELTPSECVHRKDRYSACPALRFLDGYYYVVYLEAQKGGYAPHMSRSHDLKTWQDSPFNPIMRYSEEDKRIANPALTEEQRQYIAGAEDCNNSDVDFCEFEGKTVLYYSWGNQQGKEFLAAAEYEGSEASFLKGFFPDDVAAVFVAPDGDDANPGTRERPFKTIQRAQAAVREITAAGAARDVIVQLRDGLYYVPETIVFEAADSGKNDGTITYRNYAFEAPILAAGAPVASWTGGQNGLLTAQVEAFAKDAGRPVQILEGGAAAVVAQAPNEGWFRLWEPRHEPTWSFRYDAEDFSPQGWDTSQLQVHLIMMGTYFSNRYNVTAVDVEAHRLVTDGKASDPAYNPVSGKCYRLENALELLDAPGEFYANRKSGELFYRPISSTPDKARIVVNDMEDVVRFASADASAPVHNIVLDGLRIEGGHNQISLTNAERITIKNCRLAYAGNTGIRLLDGARSNLVTGCEIGQAGCYGVELACTYEKPASGAAVVSNHHNTIHNNYIHHAGRLTITGSCIMLQRATNDDTISNNLLTDTPKSGVLMFSGWDTPREWAVMNNNVIRNNDMARCVERGWDGGAFYIGATTDHTEFTNNRIADAWSWFNATWAQPEDRPKDVCAIDFDPGMTFDTQIRHNRCYGANADNVEFGRYEDETLLENNAFEHATCAGFEFLDAPGDLLVNGRWERTKPFDAAKTDPAVGLTGEYAFPFPKECARPPAFPWQCGFEGTLSPFYVYRYAQALREDILTHAQVHEGQWAFRVDTDVCVLRYVHPTLLSKKVSVWLCDDVSKSTACCFARLSGPGAIEQNVVALGVDGAVANDRYACVEGIGRVVATSIARTAGWHEFTFTVRDEKGEGCVMAIDGQPVAAVPELRAFNTIELGDASFGSDSRGLCFDSVSVE